MVEQTTYKDALLKKRGEILGTGGIKPLQASMENNTRQGDMADQASGNNEVHIQLKLKQTDAKILLQRVDLMADRGRGDAEFLGRLAEAFQPGGRLKGSQGAERRQMAGRRHEIF